MRSQICLDKCGMRQRNRFFCTSRGAMCAGSAQVTLFELRRSYYPGCNPSERQRTTKTKNTKQHTTHKHQRGSNLLRNSLGHVGRVKKVRQGEPGATNSARCSVVLVPQRSHTQVSTSVRVLVRLVQWRLQTSPSWLVAKTRFSPMHCRNHRPAPMSSYQSGPQAKIGQPCKSGKLLSGRHRPSTHRQEVAGRGRPQPW